MHGGVRVLAAGLSPVPGGPRAELTEVATRLLAPRSGDALENDHRETAVWADLVPRRGRRR